MNITEAVRPYLGHTIRHFGGPTAIQEDFRRLLDKVVDVVRPLTSDAATLVVEAAQPVTSGPANTGSIMAARLYCTDRNGRGYLVNVNDQNATALYETTPEDFYILALASTTAATPRFFTKLRKAGAPCQA